MKMNETVARIVDLMFDNAEMTEEVSALRDEVMNNCQERFHDLVASGVSEDDAIAAVIESLRGMEDVIGQYQRKNRRTAYAQPQPAAEYTAADETDDVPVIGARDLVFSPEELHRIDLTLISEDVELLPSDDGMYHVQWECDGENVINVRTENGALKVERLPGGAAGKDKRPNIRVESRDGRSGHIYVNGKNLRFDSVEDTLEGVGGMLEGLGSMLGRMFSSMKNAFNSCDTVTIRIPHCAVPHVRLTTTSGDLEVTDVALAELNIVTTSGDVTVNLAEDCRLPHMALRSTSGDLDVTAFAEHAGVSSTSGDVEVDGCYTSLDVNTISGDIDVRAEVTRVNFKAISGDVDLAFESDALREISGSTISGDIDVDLPSGVGFIAINTSTRSGDVTTRYSTTGVGPTVSGSISSMSGDITIR